MFSRLGTFLQQGTLFPIAGVLLLLMLVATKLPMLWSIYAIGVGSMCALLGLSRPRPAAIAPVAVACTAGYVLMVAAGFPPSVYWILAVLFAGPMLLPLGLALAHREFGLSLTLLQLFFSSWIAARILGGMGFVPDWETLFAPIAELQPAVHAQFWEGGGRELLTAVGLDLFLAGGAISAVLTLLIARSWQAGLADSHDFRAEFRSIDFGKATAVVYLALLLPAAFYGTEMPALLGLYLVLTMALTFQLTATVHEIASTLNPPAPRILLGVFYSGLLFFHQLALMLCALSALDKLFGLRARLPLPRQGD